MTRACPFCAERIQSAAILCRFCGKTIEPVAAPAARRDRTLLMVALLALLVVLGIALLYVYRSQAPAGRPVAVSEALERYQEVVAAAPGQRGERITYEVRRPDSTFGQLAGLSYAVVTLLPIFALGLFLYLVIRLAVRHALTR